MSSDKKKTLFKIGNEIIKLGERKKVFLHIGSLYDYTKLSIPVEVIRGKEPGPVLFISAAIHGDELNGVEIIKRLLQKTSLKRIKGTLIAVPVVNVFGYNNKSRYLPDRRDLNRCFPGKREGSLGARLASIFMKEIVMKCTHGIDFHTGAIHRTNLPQIRACLDHKETDDLAKCFGVPVVMHSKLRDGSLREAARKKKVTTLLFEGGEALKVDEKVINIGLKGCLSVMKKIGMISHPNSTPLKVPRKAYVSESSFWIRAPKSGSFRARKKIGDLVKPGDIFGVISDPFGDNKSIIRVHEEGIIIGMITCPLVNKGDAIVHVAYFKNTKRVKAAMNLIDEEIY